MVKLSIRGKEFINPIVDALQQGKKLVIWHQLPWLGGYQEWFLIERLDALTTILNSGRVASAFTAYEWIELPISRVVNGEWLAQVSAALAQESPNEMLLIQAVELGSPVPVRLTWIGESENIEEYLQQNSGSLSVVGRIPNVWTGEIVRGYFPDADGVPQSGAY